ncbi:hypothetical protein [Ruegeria profundi]|uniref:hypothetical protein n=1 Tax=Ruegeria profundi TaxID=1685378 RepID=UPI001CD2AE45|nr:hypothetical protein [Ruegeria profundi]MCA0928683.1 hypothetical protein [Ruegeria profundi]
MKPAFALSFSATGISVHHQSDSDWYCVGEVALDAPDLNAQLFALRDRAFALENNLTCQIIIPADQVRFLSVEADAQSQSENAEQTLADATPYSVDELVFDSATIGPTTHIAAVTRQTLIEAQDFATEHGFVPVQITTESAPEDFPAKPMFPVPDIPSAPEETAEGVEKDKLPANVHVIADETPPESFRSVPTPISPGQSTTNVLAKHYVIPGAVALGLAVLFGAWALIGSDTDESVQTGSVQSEEAVPEPDPQADVVSEATPETPAISTAQVEPQITDREEEQPDVAEDAPEISPTDAAILEALTVEPTKTPPSEEAEVASPPTSSSSPPADDAQPELTQADEAIRNALNIAPKVVEDIARDPEPPEGQALPGVTITAPEPLEPPVPLSQDEPYLASVDGTNLSNDAIALPSVQSYDTDAPFERVALPSVAGTRFELDDSGLVTPTVEGTLNPEGIVVYLGRPSKVPPEPPVRFEEEPTLEEAPDSRLAGLRPKLRPEDLTSRFERQQLGGRTREELAVLRPKLRPASLQQQPEVDETPTALAVVRVPRPKLRPAGLAPATATAQPSTLGSTAAVSQPEADTFQPKAVAPKIPSSASVARQATIDNAMNLRKLNLIGVYGTPANRRALVRLPSGRYKKLKVGDRIDGGQVIAIGDSELRYQKKGRNVTLKMPRG